MNSLLTAQALFDHAAAALLLLARIGGLLASAPAIDNTAVPGPAKVYLAVILTLLIYPLVPVAAPVHLFPEGVLSLLVQVLIGVAMGVALQVVFAAVELGMQVVSQQMGLGFAALQDPVHGAQVPMLGRFYGVLLVLLFLTLDGHLVLIDMLVRSFSWATPNAALPASLPQALLDWSQQIFTAAVALALPLMTALLLTNLAFGVITRAAPQLNILVIGFPLSLLAGFALVAFSLPLVLPRLTGLLDRAIQQLPVLFGGAG